MNRFHLGKMALSTLLLSAIATPAFADADRTLPQAQTAAVTLSAASAPVQGSIQITAPVPDLLGLVETYAPETVQDWTDMLNRYKKAFLLKVKVLNLDTTGEVSAITASGEGTASAVRVAPTAALTEVIPSFAGSVPATDLQNAAVELKDSIQLAGTDGAFSAFSAGTAASPTADFTVVVLPDSLSFTGLTGSVVVTAAAPALLPLTEDNGFFKAQSALAEAVESKDASAVKQALAGLLIQYKELTIKLEKAK